MTTTTPPEEYAVEVRDPQIQSEQQHKKQPKEVQSENDDDNKLPKDVTWNKFKRIDDKKREKFLLRFQFLMLFIATTLCVASFRIPTLKNAWLKGIAMWQWCLFISALLCGPLLSRGIVNFIKLFIDRGYSMKENVIYYLVGLVESAWVMFWFSIIFVAWLWVKDEPKFLGVSSHESRKINPFLKSYHIIDMTFITLILGSFLWLLKDFFLMMAKSSFHIRRFFYRIKRAISHRHIFYLLTEKNVNKNVEKKRRVFPNEKRKLIEEDYFSKLDNVNEDNVSCWGMKYLIEEIVEHHTLSYKKGQVEKKIDSEQAALEAAAYIFNLLKPLEADSSSAGIGKEDLKRKFPDEKDLNKVMDSLLEKATREKIGKEDIERQMVNIYMFRQALVRAVAANKRVFQTLSTAVNVLIVIFIVVLWLIMLAKATREVVLFIGSSIVAAAFVFGDPCKNLLQNFLFVFMVHPYDIGDHCVIDKIPVTIDDITIFTTTVLTSDNEMRTIPNTALIAQSINNYTRSTFIGDSVAFSLNNITVANIDELKRRTKSYIEKKPEHWSDKHQWELEIKDKRKIKMTLNIQHTVKYLEFQERQIRKSELVFEIKKILDDLQKQSGNHKQKRIEIIEANSSH